MASEYEKQKRLHFDLGNVGLRAQATAVGLIQLCLELRRASVLDDDALSRIKGAIADEVSVSTPRSMTTVEYRGLIADRLDRLFAGEADVGSAEALAGRPMEDQAID